MNCPKCDSDKVVPLLYGIPSEKGYQAIEAQKRVAGGEMYRWDYPTHACLECLQWFLLIDSIEYKERLEMKTKFNRTKT